MTRQIVGALLCALPVGTLLIFAGTVMVKQLGWRGALTVWTTTAVFTASVAAGSYLAFGG